MAKWSGNKIDSSNINKGFEFKNGDNLAVDELNAIVDNSFYASNIAESVSSQISNIDPNEKIEFKGSNPNLLLNGDFSKNTRGLSSYTINSYTVDEWKSSSEYLTVNVVPTGISLSGGTRIRYLQQEIKNFKDLIGKTVTFSIKVKGVSGVSGKLNFFDAKRGVVLNSHVFEYSGNYQTVSYTETIPGDFESLCVLIYMNNASSVTTAVVYVDWAKLEVGSVATPYSPNELENYFIDNMPSNPNLLINGDFRVNQRGWTTGNTAKAYTVDRWVIANNDYTTVTVNTDKSITVSASGGSGYLIQKLDYEDGDRIKGKMVTFSACDIDDNIISVSNVAMDITGSSPSLKTSWGYLRVFYNSNTNIQEATIHVEDGKSVTLKWVKLEFGAIRTPFVPRPYAEELALCKRYYRKYTALAGTSGAIIGIFFSATSSGGYMLIDYGVSMRKSPALTYDISKILVSLGTSSSFTNFEKIGFADISDFQKGMFYCTGTFEAGKVYMVRISGDSALEVDAEL